MLRKPIIYTAGLIALMLSGCQEPLNLPYDNNVIEKKTLFTAFSARPKHLDPAKSYSSNEWEIIAQVYESPLQYDYLKRPYALRPQAAVARPVVRYLDDEGNATDIERASVTEYLITLRDDLRFQPHPMFAKIDGKPRYYPLANDGNDYSNITDFQFTGTRRCTAQDFVYQIKRLADPTLQSPILGLMQQYIIGFDALNDALMAAYDALPSAQRMKTFIDLDEFVLEGVKVINDQQYSIRINGVYPQFEYWLAMPFFAAVPKEAEAFYRQGPLIERNVTLDWYPVGTGPFMLKENNPNLRMILTKNPNYHEERFTTLSEYIPQRFQRALNRKLPLIHEVHFILEKEGIPYWHKFLQGYYDQSGVTSDTFSQALSLSQQGQGFELSEFLVNKGIRLETAPLPTIFYWGFNWLDDTVGGHQPANQALRQAIAHAVDFSEYIQIFLNGRAQVANSPIPPGIFGHTDAPNTYAGQHLSKTARIEAANALLREAGYPNGIDPKTNAPLVLYYDAIASGNPDERARLNWLRKQFDQINIELVVRATDYNRFQDKMRNGQAQLFSWGWNADYPDPENFLFLFLSHNQKVGAGGENAANYANPQFDKLFKQMKTMPDGPERAAIVEEMITLVQADSPWLFGFYPESYALQHDWYHYAKPHPLARNTLKYVDIDVPKRLSKIAEWNQPKWLPLLLIALVVLAIIIPVWRTHQRIKHRHYPPQPARYAKDMQ